jgi:hypothetical protein
MTSSSPLDGEGLPSPQEVVLAQVIGTPQGMGVALAPGIDDPILFCQNAIAAFAQVAAQLHVKKRQSGIAVPQMRVLRPR